MTDYDRIMGNVVWLIDYDAAYSKAETDAQFEVLREYINRSLGQIGRRAVERIRKHRAECGA